MSCKQHEDCADALAKCFPSLMENVYCGIELCTGWCPLVNELCETLMAMGCGGKVAQIKEKFGTLRFYINNCTEAQYEAVHEAEDKSASLCLECGAPGKLTGKGYLLTLCEPCELLQRKQKR